MARRTTTEITVEHTPRKQNPTEPAEKNSRRTKRASKALEEPETKPKTRRSKSSDVVEDAPKRRSKKVQEEVEEKPKTRRGKAAQEDVVEAAFNPYSDLDSVLDDIEKKVGVSDTTLDSSERRQSTGNLVLDLILGGGITAGWYTNLGQEQCCKTTGATTLLAACLRDNTVPIKVYYDYEGSQEPTYIENICRTMGVDLDAKHIFGLRDQKTSQYIIPPKIRYRAESVAEKFFDYLANLLRSLPDKRKIGDSWYYVYEDTKENRKKVGDSYDKNFWRKTKQLRVPAADGSLQAIFVVDSYPSMLPERLDVDDPGSGMAAQARMFSEQIKRVKGKLKSKRVAVVGINQLRLKPAVMYGPPEYEPCGEALKFWSDARVRFASRSLSGVPEVTGKGQIEEESSVTKKGGVDQYRYINIRAVKNKLSRPFLDGWLRLWITDAKGDANGFDPVWDTYQYLKSTGQVQGKRAKMTLKFDKNPSNKAIGWLDFKRLILGDRATIKDICSSIGMKPVQLREACFKQMASGKGLDLFNEHITSVEKTDEDEDDDNSGSEE